MAKVMKSFRLSESAIAALENRDAQKYRSGQEYIEALLLNHEEKSEPTIETVLLFGKLNAAFSVRLKRVFRST